MQHHNRIIFSTCPKPPSSGLPVSAWRVVYMQLSTRWKGAAFFFFFPPSFYCSLPQKKEKPHFILCIALYHYNSCTLPQTSFEAKCACHTFPNPELCSSLGKLLVWQWAGLQRLVGAEHQPLGTGCSMSTLHHRHLPRLFFCHLLLSVPLWKHFHDDENEVLFIVASRGAKGRPALCQFKTRNLHSAGFAVAVIVFCDAGMPLWCRSVNYQQGLCPCLVPLLNKVFTETAWQLLEVFVLWCDTESKMFSFKEFLYLSLPVALASLFQQM